MRLTLVCVGSRGDVQPYLALGLGLQIAGFEVRIATHSEFEGFVRAQGLGFTPLEGDPRQILESDSGRRLLEAGRDPISNVRGLTRIMSEMMEPFLASCLRACQDTDAVIYSILGFPAYHAAQSLEIPSLGAYILPVTPTAAFPSYPSPRFLAAIGPFNRLSYFVYEQFLWQPIRPALNRWRQEVLGLPPEPFLGPFRALARNRHPIVYGFSPSVIPKPPDWGDWIHVTGYWFLGLKEGWKPPPQLESFLGAGPPPVYVGFGSMKAGDAADRARIVLEALEETGQRGILATGWGGLEADKLPEGVFQAQAVPHEWLFPRVAAVVHHGGAGTTAAGLRAGRPSVLVPFFGDQFIWGQRVFELGAGPRPVPRRNLQAGHLASAIRRCVDDGSIQERAAALGERIRGEDGVATAVEVIQARLGAG